MFDNTAAKKTPQFSLSNSNKRIWIKHPLACFTGNESDARGGIVVQGSVIKEVLSLGQSPLEPVDEVFDARETRGFTWFGEYSSSLLSNPDTSLGACG
ncbi:hypothetical protein [Marinomonas sp. GJ51-6]|uniref:hypothetical protein n=1 Tax=Marinomonas sp. GJ51-6 TaxID=2992802 RepID=UPI00293455BC|nr:hypothetical protein [Marinomonas sp. GJ51-6]WOD06797.1 hypothetical protein ONZ50_14200 [Marinomonas sp. GJ51-6]